MMLQLLTVVTSAKYQRRSMTDNNGGDLNWLVV